MSRFNQEIRFVYRECERMFTKDLCETCRNLANQSIAVFSKAMVDVLKEMVILKC